MDTSGFQKTTNDTVANEYMAFISYRHADNTDEDQQWATWLHQQLEVFDVPHEFIGTTNLRGEVIPERIYPVFRDEVSLPADANLSSAIENALERSQFLVVLCSPRAVQSKYVNQEIMHFKRCGKADRIIAGLLLGEPNASIDESKLEDPEHARTLECFPEAMQYYLNAEGELDKSNVTEPIAANFRLPDGSKGVTNPAVYKQKLLVRGCNKKDAERLAYAYEEQINTAKLKIIAGILGLKLEQLIERDKIYQLKKSKIKARKARRFAYIVSSLLMLAVIFAGAAFQQYQKAQANFERAEDLLSTVRASINFLNFDARDALRHYLPVSERERINREIDELAGLLADYGGDSAKNILQQAASYSQKADFILHDNKMDPSEALPLYQKANALMKGLDDKEPNNNDSAKHGLAVSYDKLGNVALLMGNTKDALVYYQAALPLKEHLAYKNPESNQFLRGLFVSYMHLGDVEVRLDNIPEALAHYEMALEKSKTLVDKAPENSEFQRDLAVSHYKLGNVALRLDNTWDALAQYRAALEINEALAEKYPDNGEFQRGLSVSYNNLGDVEVRLGNAKNGLTLYQAALTIRKILTDKDPDNSRFQRDLSLSYGYLRDVELRLDNTQGALTNILAGLSISKALAERLPDNSLFQRDLAVSYGHLGDVELRLGNTSEALTHYQAGLEVYKALVVKDPDNSEIQLALSTSYDSLGDAALRLGNTQGAFAQYKSALIIRQNLALADKDISQFQRELSVSYVKLANIYVEDKNDKQAKEHYQKALDILLLLQKKGILAEDDELYISQLDEILN